MADAVDWEVAATVAGRLGKSEPFSESYHGDSLIADFEELTAEAEGLVAQATGLRSLEGPARARVTDRRGWVQVNISAFQRLLGPLTERLGHQVGSGAMAPVTRKIAGAEVGALLGWMSNRVLGQYDLLMVEDERADEQDLVYYVGPNVLALEKRYAFPPREFRLWLALHEVTHRAQFTGVPWLRGHFLTLVHQTLDSVDPDPKRFTEALSKVVDDLRSGRRRLDDGGLVSLFATPAQRELIARINGLMSLLEGHGDVTMDRAGQGMIPSAGRFSRVLRERRSSTKGAARVLHRLLGLEAKMNQYALGEHFIEVVEAEGGRDLFDRVWRGPQWLPDLTEIREPSSWIERVRMSESLTG